MDLLSFRFFTDYPQVAMLARLVERICRAHIRRQVDDPEVCDELTPRFSWGCKRPSFSNDFYPIFTKPGIPADLPLDGVVGEQDPQAAELRLTPPDVPAPPARPVRRG
jgi:hypothetical protein